MWTHRVVVNKEQIETKLQNGVGSTQDETMGSQKEVE